MGLLHFCTSWKKSIDWFLFQTTFSRKFVSQTGFEYRSSVSLQSKEQVCLLTIIKHFWFPKPRIPLLWYNLLCIQVSSDLLHISLCKLELEEPAQKCQYSTSIKMSNKLFSISDPGVLCFLPASIIRGRPICSIAGGVKSQTFHNVWQFQRWGWDAEKEVASQKREGGGFTGQVKGPKGVNMVNTLAKLYNV